MGYNLEALEKLKNVAGSFDVFEGLEKYNSLEQIESEVKGKRGS